jgi:hypothetical protein
MHQSLTETSAVQSHLFVCAAFTDRIRPQTLNSLPSQVTDYAQKVAPNPAHPVLSDKTSQQTRMNTAFVKNVA